MMEFLVKNKFTKLLQSGLNGPYYRVVNGWFYRYLLRLMDTGRRSVNEFTAVKVLCSLQYFD